MQVFQHEQHRRGGRELGEQAEHAAEHLLPGQPGAVLVGRAAVAAVREQPAQRRTRAERVPDPGGLGRAAERVGQRQVRHAVAELGALAGQHGETALRGQLDDLPTEARFTDPRVPADQRDHRAARLGVVKQPEQAAELGLPPHHALG